MYTYGTEWFPLHFRLVIVLLLYCAASEDIWTPVRATVGPQPFLNVLSLNNNSSYRNFIYIPDC